MRTFHAWRTTNQESATYGKRRERCPVRKSRGHLHTDETIRELLRARHAGATYTALAEIFGMGVTTVTTFCLGYQRPHIYDEMQKEFGC